MNPNQFQYSLTAGDMAEAYAKGRRRARKKLFNGKFAAFLLTIIGLSVAASFWNDWIAQVNLPPPAPMNAAAPSLSSIWLPLVPWVVIFIFVWVVILRLRRAQFKSHRAVDRPVTLMIADDKLVLAEPFSRGEFQWKAFYGSEETKNLILLYITDPKASGVLLFHVIPKRAFPSAPLLAEFIAMLAANINSPISAFPVLSPIISKSSSVDLENHSG